MLPLELVTGEGCGGHSVFSRYTLIQFSVSQIEVLGLLKWDINHYISLFKMPGKNSWNTCLVFFFFLICVEDGVMGKERWYSA